MKDRIGLLFVKLFIVVSGITVFLCLVMGGNHDRFVKAGEAVSGTLIEDNAEAEATDGLERFDQYTADDGEDIEEQLQNGTQAEGETEEDYDRILVVDIGHGGSDPGAYISGCYEKTINLEIGKKLKELFDAQDEIKVYYTRTSDESVSLAERVGLANKVGADLFLSIHNNMVFDSDSVNGTQAMYNGDDDSGFSSKNFANICMRYLLEELGSTDKGLVEGSDIYIIRNAKMPVALVEIGFMTNSEELEKLNDEEYQQRAAQALYDAVCESFEKLADAE